MLVRYCRIVARHVHLLLDGRHFVVPASGPVMREAAPVLPRTRRTAISASSSSCHQPATPIAAGLAWTRQPAYPTNQDRRRKGKERKGIAGGTFPLAFWSFIPFLCS